MNGSATSARIGLGAALFFAVAGPAAAVCVSPIDFGQLSPTCGGGARYCYVVSPGIDVPSSILSAFWSLGTGHPALGSGDDNGAWADEEGWLHAWGAGLYLGGGWQASPEIDGCIAGRIPPGKTAEVMVVGLSDQDHYGERGFFAASSALRHPGRWPEFDLAAPGEDIVLAAIPVPIAVVTQIGPGRWLATVQPPSPSRIAAGCFGDGSATPSELVRGYRVYRKDRFPGDPLPDRRRSSWTAATGTVLLGSPISFEITCPSQFVGIYLAQSLVFESGFETGHVSESTPRLDLCSGCLPWAYDFDGDSFYQPNEFGCPLDCDDDDWRTYPGAPEINDGKDNQCWAGEGFGVVDEISGLAGFLSSWDKTAFTWRAQTGATLYEVVRSESPDLSSGCEVLATAATTWKDPALPPPGGAFHYLVRAAAPWKGSWGQDSSGAERLDVCP